MVLWETMCRECSITTTGGGFQVLHCWRGDKAAGISNPLRRAECFLEVCKEQRSLILIMKGEFMLVLVNAPKHRVPCDLFDRKLC